MLNGSWDDDASVAELEGLMTTAAQGDRVAATALLRAVAPAVVRSVRMVLGPKSSDLDDVVQQTFMAFMGALRTFRGDCHPAGFAARIAVHTALSQRRRASSQRARIAGLAAFAATEGDDAWRGANALDLSSRRRRLVRELLDRLPEEQSETLALHVMLGWSLEEIAASTACPLNTVKSRLRLAKAALRRVVEADQIDFDELEIAS